MKDMMKIEMQAIGIIHTPFTDLSGMPIQACASAGAEGTIELLKEYQQGLADLAEFSHIILIYQLHCSRGFKLKVIPYLDTQERGLFATRAPKRPNPIGLSVVKLKAIEENIVFIENVDMLSGTPLLDIKPYVAKFDAVFNSSCGWLEKRAEGAAGRLSDSRFKSK